MATELDRDAQSTEPRGEQLGHLRVWQLPGAFALRRAGGDAREDLPEPREGTVHGGGMVADAAGQGNSGHEGSPRTT